MPPKIDNPTALAVTAISHWALSICIWVEFVQYCPHIFETRRPWYLNFLGYMALVFSFLFTYLILALLYCAAISSLRWRKATERPLTAPHNQRSRADITASDSQARSSESKAEYMALPPELRNQIMKYVLTPGTIYLPQMGPTMSKYIITRPPKSPMKRSFLEKAHRAMDQSDCFWANIIVHGIGNLHFGQNSLYPPLGAPVGKRQFPGNRGSVHGFQLLATSKTVLREGQAFFWSENTFYLPRGGSEAAEYHFDNVRHEHKLLVRRIGIQFSLKDLTPPVLRALEDYIRAHPTMRGRRTETLTNMEWAGCCGLVTVRLWEEKIRWICHWPYLNHVILEFPSLNMSLTMDGERLKQRMRGILIGIDASYIDLTYNRFGARPHEVEEIDHSFREVVRRVGVVVGRIGWFGFKQWLNGEVDYEEDWNSRE